jgi:polysaccharide pyruvyl transferase WcaK-like protein
VALPQILVLLMGKPLMLLPQTIGPFKSSMGRMVARYILKRALKVYSRDKEGLDKVREIAPATRDRLAFCYDMGFVLEGRIADKRIPRGLARLDRGIPLVGFNVSGLLYMGGYTRKNMFGLKVDYRRLILDLIDFFVNKYNAHLILVPHVTGSVDNIESDTVVCQEIYNECEIRLQEHLHVISEEYDQHELKALIGRCDFFIGSRMHACIAALSQCVPAVGLAYSRKFRGVFASIGVEELVLDLRKQDHNRTMDAVARAYANREHFRGQLKAKMPSVIAYVIELFARIGTEKSGKIELS